MTTYEKMLADEIENYFGDRILLEQGNADLALSLKGKKWQAIIAALREKTPHSYVEEALLPGELVVGSGHFHAGVKVSTAQGAITRMFERMQLLEKLLEIARCPNCDGEGWYVAPHRNTGDQEQVQCEWCFRRQQFISGGGS